MAISKNSRPQRPKILLQAGPDRFVERDNKDGIDPLAC